MIGTMGSGIKFSSRRREGREEGEASDGRLAVLGQWKWVLVHPPAVADAKKLAAVKVPKRGFFRS